MSTRERELVTRQEVLSVFEPACEAMLGQVAYEDISRRTAEIAASGMPQADMIPIVHFATQATFAILKSPEIRSRLSLEVYDRAVQVRSIAENFAVSAARRGVFTTFYMANEHLAPLLKRDLLIKAIRDTEMVRSVGAQQFQDVGIIAGGAYRMLRIRKYGQTHDTVAAVTRSTHLASIAGLDRDNMHGIVTSLGRAYVRQDFLEPQLKHGNLVVNYTPSVRARIVAAKRRQRRDADSSGEAYGGCPVTALVSSQGSEHPTYLQQGWADIVRCLLSTDSTTLGDRGKHGRARR